MEELWYVENGYKAGEFLKVDGILRITDWHIDGTVAGQILEVGDDRAVDSIKGGSKTEPPWWWGVTDQTEPTAPWWDHEKNRAKE